ncbi:flagellar motor protein MotD [Nitrosomonas sp.]|uniref:flagellar motor protein MotD n=1 Tax=Nitrosomonas sp. TaxID=42353 RepID=UPI001DE85521|nr:flagellar motor protein MotD [Nitrosomonas sp.]MCB1947616.1 flagellar motor protein MotD [Nitrosomonas sp.]MCP5242250.1 flagellar motor protein MotD [Burkholderiales bacterium]MDR4514168.1 flagellar motor protein MotD [Nitrosomonas sp.]
MARKKFYTNEDVHENHERWLVSYADFITLLFAFFVVMYAVSSINEGKYKVLSGSLVNAFKNPAINSGAMQQIHVAPMIKKEPQQESLIKVMEEKEVQRIKKQEVMESMAKNVLKVLAPLVDNGKVRVTQSNLGITVEINASVLFSPGEAQLSDDSIETLQAVAQVLKQHNHEIQVEGHTDNLPIHNAFFPSNWELSTARASSVIRLFINSGLSGQKLTAIGYGENRPVETNDTIEGRMRNRRVTIMIMSNEQEKVTEIPVSLN